MTTEAPVQSALAIEMRNIAVSSIRDSEAISVEEVNWNVAPGDFWAIGGLHGSGRSDLLMMAGGLMGPARGSYHFFGNEMPIFEGEHLPVRLRLGFVFHDGNLLNQLTVAQNVALPLRYHRNLKAEDADRDVNELLAHTELEPWAGSTPGAMTHGWRKRAGLARALMLRPEVLLLDGPLTGLDLRHRSWWLNFLGELSKGHAWMKGKPITIAVSTDDFRPWQDLARQFAALKEKRFVVLGSWQQLQAANDQLVHELHVEPQML